MASVQKTRPRQTNPVWRELRSQGCLPHRMILENQARGPTVGTGRSYDHPKSGRSPSTGWDLGENPCLAEWVVILPEGRKKATGNHPTQECATLWDYFACMLQVSNERLQIFSLAMPLTRPLINETGNAVKFFLRQLRLESQGVQFNAEYCHDCWWTFELVRVQGNTPVREKFNTGGELLFAQRWVGGTQGVKVIQVVLKKSHMVIMPYDPLQ